MLIFYYMKKPALSILLLIFCQLCALADISVFSENGKFGLKDSKGQILVEPEYKKLVRLGETSWIMQKRAKFGIISDDGDILVKPAYNQAERILGKYVKFRKGIKYCLLNEHGENILSNKNEMYSSIDLLYGGLIVTSKNNKYGLKSFNGKIELDNVFDDIYMTDKDTIVIVYAGKIMEFKRSGVSSDTPFDFDFKNLKNGNLQLSDITSSPLASTGYYGVTFTDYVLKLFSSISPAYEQTIDELMFSQGADTVSVFIKCTWLPKFPFVYAKNYYINIINPYNGPLNRAKKSLRKQIK